MYNSLIVDHFGNQEAFPTEEDPSGRFPRKRRQIDESENVNSPKYIEKFVQLVGEKPDEDYSLIAESLLVEFAKFRDEIFDALEICISEIPAKTVIYSKLTDALNRQDPDFVRILLVNLAELIEIRFKRCEFDQVLLILKFFCIICSIEIVSLSSLLELFEQFCSLGEERDDEMKHLILRLILPCYPYLIPRLLDTLPSFIDQFLSRTQGWIDMIQHRLSTNESFISITVLEPTLAYWNSIQELKTFDWNFNIPIQKKEHVIVAEHDIKSLKISALSLDPKYFLSNYFVSVDFSQVEGESTCNLFDKLWLWENVRITLIFFHMNIKRGLETVCNEMNDPLFEREYTFAFFTNMLSLHIQNQKTFSCCAAMINLCRMRPTIATFLGRIIRFFYENCDSIENFILFIFYEWFSSHLSNFNLKWNWDEWAGSLDNSLKLSQKRIFVEEVIDRLSRNFFVLRIKSALPECFGDIIVELCSKGCNESIKNDSSLDSLVNQIRLKNFFLELFHENPPSVDSISKFIRSFLIAGSATISHSVAFLEMHKNSLTEIAQSNQQGAELLIQEVFIFWKENVQFFEVLIQKMLLYKIIRPIQFINCYFQLLIENNCIRFKRWDVIFVVLDTIKLRITQCNQSIAEIRSDFDEEFVI